MTKNARKRAAIPRHAKAPVEAALTKARASGWLANYPASHAFAVIFCPHGHTACRMSVNSTPRSPEAHGRAIERKVAQCRGGEGAG